VIRACSPDATAPMRSASAYFLLNRGAGLHNIQRAFNETMSGGEGFGFDYAATGGVSATPRPPSWTMVLIGLIGFGFCCLSSAEEGSCFRRRLLTSVNRARSIFGRGAAV
jgi:hypothetical protein